MSPYCGEMIHGEAVCQDWISIDLCGQAKASRRQLSTRSGQDGPTSRPRHHGTWCRII
ncbi:uncharacterized protein UV8b_05211 [Ustilaginoidea virens]|uniref:Uncharacterized protein n=1 Tax=Ustilaginoidea virens TaxID=1159556 RepID=A0A8E5HT94_USTVR|nr:uncharacterized protein UV8b_05211 [Ustilaginoidea virens]QUC20970.1 hypothetical protein UV8b_05211 [Ustilaginoidea virens]